MQASGNTSDVAIPAVYVDYGDYQVLRGLAKEYFPVVPYFQVRLTPDESRSWAVANILFARIVAPVVVMLILYTMAFKCRKTRHKKAQEALEIKVSRLPKRIHEETKGQEDSLCAICLDVYVPGDELRVLRCRHDFHLRCIDPWLLTRKQSCPLCKAPVFQDEETSLV